MEGWEYSFLPEVLRSSSPPHQLGVELHYWSSGPKHEAGFVRLLSAVRQQYALVDRHDNRFCAHCSEVLFVRHNLTL